MKKSSSWYEFVFNKYLLSVLSSLFQQLLKIETPVNSYRFMSSCLSSGGCSLFAKRFHLLTQGRGKFALQMWKTSLFLFYILREHTKLSKISKKTEFCPCKFQTWLTSLIITWLLLKDHFQKVTSSVSYKYKARDKGFI